MSRTEYVVVIDADPVLVVETLVDVERWPEWTDSVDELRRLDAGPLAVGSRAVVSQPRLRPSTWEVTELDPERGFTWQSTVLGVRSVADHFVEAGPAGTVVTLGVLQTGPLSGLVALLAGRLVRRYVAMEGDGLKRRCEQ